MKTSKKILSILLSVMMILSIIPLTASAVEPTSGTCGDDLTWEYDFSTYTLTILGTGEMNNYESYNRPWESYEYIIKTVVINDSVTTIGRNAFSNCDILTSVTIPDSVTTIGRNAFSNCDSLTSVTIPDSVTTIGDSAFYGCNNLKEVNINDISAWCNISFGGYDANPLFYAKTFIVNGEAVTDLVIPDGVTEIKDYAFGYCDSLTSVTIPDSVTTIGNYAFAYCDSLTSVTIPDSVTTIGYSAFEYCKSLTSVTIGDSVTSIGDSAFYNCTSLTSITIPDSVTSIGSYAFYMCTSLTSVTIPDTVTSIGGGAFRECGKLECVTIPDSVTSIGYDAFFDCDNLKSVYISDMSLWCNIYFEDERSSPLCNGADLYLNDKKVTDLVIPDNTNVLNYAFYGCTSLTSVTIPGSVRSTGSEAFSYCINLKSVTLLDGVVTIDYCSFIECTSLESITIPNSVISIDFAAFYECTSLTDVYYNCTEKQWNSVVIDNMENGNAPLHNATIHYTGHSIDSKTITDATCTNDGVYLDVCSLCGETSFNFTEATGHSYESVVVAPTCTMQGYTAYTCECGDTYYEDYTDALGHTEEILPAVAPTCTKTGLTEGEKCTACNEIIVAQEVVEANGHNYTITETSATCTQIGYVTCVCDCGDTYISTIIPATGHSFVDGTCENCFEKESGGNSDVNCTIHTYTWETVVEASCTQRGVCIGTCSVCEDAVVDYHDATGHNMVNGDCTNCDYTENNEPSQPNEPSEPTDPSEECDCNCHKGGFFWKFVLFFQKLFGANKTCSCGVAHY